MLVPLSNGAQICENRLPLRVTQGLAVGLSSAGDTDTDIKLNNPLLSLSPYPLIPISKYESSNDL